jgi:hypothetical protein
VVRLSKLIISLYLKRLLIGPIHGRHTEHLLLTGGPDLQKLLFFLLLIPVFLYAQKENDDKPAFGIKFHGFVKTDVHYDTRQTVAARDGNFLLYPAKEILDENNNDINAVPQFNILSLQSRLKGTISAPDIFGAKTIGVIEGSFFGHSNADLNEFRLRHAFLKLIWKNSSLLIGQYWHPMFVVEVFPGTISFNTGVPFQPFSRNPQIQFVQKFSNLHVGITALTQADFVSTGPIGASSIYLRNSGLPILDLTLKYMTKNFVAGAGANYKTLVPRIQDTGDSNQKYKTEVSINSIATMGFIKLVHNDFTIKAEGIYGQNLTDMLMLGGYAVSDTTALGFASDYTNINTLSLWTELIYGKKLQLGLFAGYTKNLGANDNIVGPSYTRGADIETVMRISPRIQYSIGKARFAVEIEYTAAGYGTPDIKGVVKDVTSVANLRMLFSTYLFF